MSGDFSANVLQEALDKVWSLKCEDTRRSDLKSQIEAAPAEEQGYLCHLEDHWIALRRLESDGSWWNLNSLEDDPTHLSPLYLGVFLKQLQLEGWTLYVVRGDYPQTPLNHSSSSWRFVQDPSGSGSASRSGHQAPAVDNDEERFQRELEAAIAASMGQGEGETSHPPSGDHHPQPPQDTSTHTASTQHNNTTSATGDPAGDVEMDEEDEDLKLAILLSKQDN